MRSTNYQPKNIIQNNFVIEIQHKYSVSNFMLRRNEQKAFQICIAQKI